MITTEDKQRFAEHMLQEYKAKEKAERDKRYKTESVSFKVRFNADNGTLVDIGEYETAEEAYWACHRHISWGSYSIYMVTNTNCFSGDKLIQRQSTEVLFKEIFNDAEGE